MRKSHRWCLFTATILAIGLIASTTDVVLAQDKLDRTTLPIEPPKRKPITEMDARKATKPAPLRVEAPAFLRSAGTFLRQELAARRCR